MPPPIRKSVIPLKNGISSKTTKLKIETMIKGVKCIGLILIVLATVVQAQDTTKVKGFEYSKLKPLVHFFTSAEYNPSSGVSKDFSFWLGRAQFGFNYDYDKHFSGKILIERTRLAGSINTMYVKVANLRWTPNNRLAIEGGIINQNNYIPFETLWGYRFIAETFQDRYYLMPSTDLGVAAYFKINKRLTLDAGITNGEGPKIDQDNFGKMKFAGGLTFNPDENWETRIFYHRKSSGETGYTAKENLFNAYAGYRNGDKFRVGAEFIYVDGFMSMPGIKSYGGTIFGVVTLHKTLKFLVRCDQISVLTQSGHALSPLSGSALITGFLVNPVKGINLSLNYQGFFPEDRSNNSTHRLLFSVEYRL